MTLLLKSLAELGQLYNQQPSPTASGEASPRRAPVSIPTGYIVHLAIGRLSGFLEDGGASECSLTDHQHEAWRFASRQAARCAFYMALGLNGRTCRFKIVPAIASGGAR